MSPPQIDITPFFCGIQTIEQLITTLKSKTDKDKVHPLDVSNINFLFENNPKHSQILSLLKGREISKEDINKLDNLISAYFGCSFEEFVSISNSKEKRKRQCGGTENKNWSILSLALSDFSFAKFYPYYLFENNISTFTKIGEDKKSIYYENELKTIQNQLSNLTEVVKKLSDQFQQMNSMQKSVSTQPNQMLETSIMKQSQRLPTTQPITQSKIHSTFSTVSRTEELLQEGRVIDSASADKVKSIESVLKIYRNSCTSFVNLQNQANESIAEYLEAMIHNAIWTGFSKKQSLHDILDESVETINQSKVVSKLNIGKPLDYFLNFQIKKIFDELKDAKNIRLGWFRKCNAPPQFSKLFDNPIQDLDNPYEISYTCIMPAIFFGNGCNSLGEHYQLNK